MVMISKLLFICIIIVIVVGVFVVVFVVIFTILLVNYHDSISSSILPTSFRISELRPESMHTYPRVRAIEDSYFSSRPLPMRGTQFVESRLHSLWCELLRLHKKPYSGYQSSPPS